MGRHSSARHLVRVHPRHTFGWSAYFRNTENASRSETLSLKSKDASASGRFSGLLALRAKVGQPFYGWSKRNPTPVLEPTPFQRGFRSSSSRHFARVMVPCAGRSDVGYCQPGVPRHRTTPLKRGLANIRKNEALGWCTVNQPYKGWPVPPAAERPVNGPTARSSKSATRTHTSCGFRVPSETRLPTSAPPHLPSTGVVATYSKHGVGPWNRITWCIAILWSEF